MLGLDAIGSDPAAADPRPQGPPLRRPMLRVALAMASGSALGVGLDWPSHGYLLVAGLLAAAALGWHAALLRWRCFSPQPGDDGDACGGSRDGGASPGAPNRAAATPTAAWLAGLVCLAAARAAAPDENRAADANADPVAAWEGRWTPRQRGEDETIGALAAGSGDAVEVELPDGIAREGDRLRILRGSPASQPARGPVQPHSSGQRPPLVAAAEPDEVLRLAPGDEGPGAIAATRARFVERTAAWDDRRAASLARAFLLGDSQALDPATSDLFTRNGLRHVLAVSGWHVAMMAYWIVRPLAAAAAWLAERRPRRRRAIGVGVALLTIAACALYAPLTGGDAPVRRSAIAVALAASAALWPMLDGARVRLAPGWRRIDALSLWATALALECGIDPRATADVAVQLSYAATWGLIVGTGPLRERCDRALGGPWNASTADLLGGEFRLCLGAVVRRARWSLLTAFAASMAAVLATLPIIWWTFGEGCAWGVLSTPLLAPLFIGMFVAGMAWWLLPIEPLSQACSAAFQAAASALLDSLSAIDRLPGTPMLLPERPLAALLVSLLLCVAAWLGRSGASRWRRAANGAAPLAAGLLWIPWQPTPARLEVQALDVGHGTAVALRLPGNGVWIFDAGSRDRSRVGSGALGPLLRRWEASETTIVLSHGDQDHAGGLRWLVERAPPVLWAGADPARWSERLPHTCVRLDLTHGELALPLRGAAVHGRLLRGAGGEDNEGSRSLALESGGRRWLLCGDAEDSGWPPDVLARVQTAPGGVLLAPHHGSAAGRVGDLLNALAPDEVWISAPAVPPIAAELDRRRIPWRCTGLEGPLEGP